MTECILEKQWSGEKATFPYRYLYGNIEGQFVFTVFWGECFRNTSSTIGLCTPGLWKQDVAELFFHDQNSERYFELNLAPSGAWWGCLFSSYRIVLTDPSIVLPIRIVQTKNSSSIFFKENFLIKLGINDPLVACTGMSAGEYLSLRSEKTAPDFHLRSIAR